MGRVTQRDIAAKAGVSQVTVSLALRDHRSIPESTRQRIKQLARRCGYVSDPMLSALSLYRSKHRPAVYHANLAWVNTWRTPKELYRWDYVPLHEAAKTRAAELGYVLEEVALAKLGYSQKRLQRLLLTRGITGLILAPAEDPDRSVDIDCKGLSLVRLGYSVSKPEIHTVTNSQFRTCRVALERLAGLGYRRIGLVLTVPVNVRTRNAFLGAFLAARGDLGAAGICEPLLLPEPGPVAEPLREWLRRERPDAVLAWGDTLLDELALLRIRPPRGLAFASLNLVESDQRVSGMHQNPRNIGASAVDLLISMMQRGETGLPKIPLQLLVAGSWRPGSTAPPAAPAFR